jgi:hypothetical protein
MFIRSYRIAPGASREITPPICLGAALRQTSFATRRVGLCVRVNMPDRRAAPAQNPNSMFSRIIPVNPEPTTASAQIPKSTFSRIIPMNPEPTAATAQNPKSAFSRIIPMNPEPTAATAQNPKSTFSRIIPMNPEPTATPAQNPKFAFSRINPASLEPPAACSMTRMIPTAEVADPSNDFGGWYRAPGCPGQATAARRAKTHTDGHSSWPLVMTAPSRQTYDFTRLPCLADPAGWFGVAICGTAVPADAEGPCFEVC